MKMAISLEMLTSRFVSAKAEIQAVPPLFSKDDVFGAHKAIFEHYGIDYNTIDPTQVTRFDTVDGEFCVFGDHSTISPPPGFYTSRLRSTLIKS